MNIHKIAFILGLATLVATGCSSSSGQYEINGIYTAPDGTEVYLVNLNSKDTLGTSLVKDKGFYLKGRIQEPAYVYLGKGKERVRFILERGNVTADIDERIEYGTPLVDQNNLYHKRFYGFNAQRNKERMELDAVKSSLSTVEYNSEWDRITSKYLTMQADLADSVVRANPDNLFGAIVMEDLAATDTARFMARHKEVSKEVRDFYLVRKAYESIRKSSATAPGKMFTDYLVQGGNLDGTDARLSDYVGKGKYILLDHWASWCGPCKAEMPYLLKTYEAFAGESFDIVSVAVNDKREDTLKELEKLKLPWNQILDAGNIPSETYQVNAIPHLILFSPDGTILQRGLRGEKIYTTIKELLASSD